MPTDLIQTKLIIPPSRGQLVQRQRLYEQLNGSADHKLTLMTAPAGFGKSTLLSSWAGQYKQPISWYALDHGDNDPERFLAYLLMALHHIAPELRLTESAAALSKGQDPAALEQLLTFLINEFQRIEEPVSLILDDYHVIQDPHVNHIVTFLLDHAPSTVHLLVASRREPAFATAKLRASGQLLELNEQDLRFTLDEAAQFIHSVMGLPIPAEDIVVLEQRTEGWAAGLQLAALSLDGREDIGDFIAGLRGTNRYILDYLAEEVFSRLPELLQDFLLRISVVDRFNAPLCDALLDDWQGTTWDQLDQLAPGSSALRSDPILEFLDASNLFVFPMDHERQWYRFHQLFADFLKDQLTKRHPQETRGLHQRAARWFSSEGFLTEAIQHALAAGDPDQASVLIEAQVKPMLSRGETRTLTRWIEALPPADISRRPALLFGQVWSYILSDPIRFRTEIQQIVSGFDTALGVTPETVLNKLASPGLAPETIDLLGQYALLLGFLGRDDQPHEVSMAYFEAALDAFAPDDFFTRSFALSGLASTLARQGRLAHAEETFAQAAELAQHTESPYLYLVAKDWEATMQVQQGKLHQAETTFRFVIDQLETMRPKNLPLTAHAYVGLADVLLEWDKLQEALVYVNNGIDRGQRTIDRDALLEGFRTQTRIYHALGDAAAAKRAMAHALGEARRAKMTSCYHEAVALEALLNLSSGDLPAALRWAEARGIREDLAGEGRDSLLMVEQITLARLRMAQGEILQAERILDGMLRALEGSELGRLTLQVRAMLSMVLEARGDREAAQQILARALLQGEPEGFTRSFIDEGPQMAALLRSTAASGRSPEYARELLAAFSDSPAGDSLVEPLSARELDVLRLMSDGLTNAAIARELVVAQSTVKTHINHIYTKLGVTQRTQAIARARELHLLN